MSTKNNPGAFRCYEAALPDEPIFTILARDPAGPATLRYWIYQRAMKGKNVSPEDIDRIDDADRVARQMEAWRAANAEAGPDGQPTWRNVGVTDELGGPIRMEPDNTVYIYAERDGDEAVRLSIDWLQARCRDLNSGLITRGHFTELMALACKSPDKRRERVVPVEDAAYDAAARDARSITLFNAVKNAVDMLDEIAKNTEREVLLSPIRQTLVNGLLNAPQAGFPPPGFVELDEFLKEQRKVGKVAELGMGYSPDIKAKVAVGLGQVATDLQQFVHGKVPNPESHQTAQLLLGFVDRINGYAAELHEDPYRLVAAEPVVVDTQPTDLAHNPEVPPHRFSTFHKGERYAYARGLEINPIHLPVALDAMARDGWHLLAIFGQTDSKHVGFIFERRPEPVMLMSMGTLDEPCGALGMGRGLEP